MLAFGANHLERGHGRSCHFILPDALQQWLPSTEPLCGVRMETGTCGIATTVRSHLDLIQCSVATTFACS